MKLYNTCSFCLLTLQPHTTGLQETTPRKTNPVEGTSAAGSVHSTLKATSVPESATKVHCTVSCVEVVVAVIRGEHHAVLMAAECIKAGVT